MSQRRDIDPKLVKAWVRQGKSLNSLRAHLGCGGDTLYRVVKQHKIKSCFKGPKLTADDIDSVSFGLRAGLPVRVVAEIHKVSPSTLRRFLKKHGLV